jgi:hypothetical protein
MLYVATSSVRAYYANGVNGPYVACLFQQKQRAGAVGQRVMIIIVLTSLEQRDFGATVILIPHALIVVMPNCLYSLVIEVM